MHKSTALRQVISRPIQIRYKHSLSLRGKIGLGRQAEHKFLCRTPQNVISRAKGTFYNFVLSSFKSLKRSEEDYKATFFSFLGNLFFGSSYVRPLFHQV